MQAKLLYLCFFLLFFIKCKDAPRQIHPAFYHWQTNFNLAKAEVDYLDSLKVQSIYAKFFDVDWDANRQEAVPLALINIQAANLRSFQVIPTVFITNRTMLNIAEENIPDLAKKISSKIEELYQIINQHPLTEIQLDCDWTPKTKDKYFTLLEYLKQKNPTIQLSATIRLHQVKFFEKTGVPPVQKGMLMFYNMGNVSDINTQNSILDMNIAKDYFVNFDRYPLTLDLALPIFAWGVLIRDGKMIKLINNLRADQLADQARFIKTEENFFQVIKSTYLDGYYLYEDDKIRLEQVSLDDLAAATTALKILLPNPDLTLSFYHLDTTVIKHYPYESLEKICQAFR